MKRIMLGDSRVNLVAELGEIVDVRTGQTYRDIVVPEDSVQFYHDEVNDELKDAKLAKLAEIERYDSSGAVNSFFFRGKTMWIDKATRVGLVNAVDMAMLLGKPEITFGIGGISVTLGCDEAKGMLATLEMYALECYNVTLRHRQRVEALTSIEDVERYNYVAGYPDKLEF